VRRRLHATLAAALRAALVLALACSPLGQPMALAALAAPPQEPAAGGCTHHAQAAQPAAEPIETAPGGCCCKKGSSCHCAMTVALPTAAALALASPASDHPVAAPQLVAASLPSPEPPPPRS